MDFEKQARTFQQKCWDKLYTELFPEFFNNYEYFGNSVTVKFKYKEFQHLGALPIDYNTAISNKMDYARPLRLVTHICKNETGECIDSENLTPLLIPELTPRGFIIKGNCYDVANLFREAFGWYITVDKKLGLIMSLKTKMGGKFIVVEKGGELFLERNKKSIGFGVFLKAVTEMDSASILSTLNTSNSMVIKTIKDQLTAKGYELPLSECIVDSMYFISRGRKTRDDFAAIPDETLRKMFIAELERIDIGSEGVERWKKFITFQRRAEGSTLMNDVVLTDGTLIRADTNLSRVDLINLDNDENINEIYVSYEGQAFSIKKFDVSDGKFNSDMMFNIASIAFAVFNGLGLIDDRDSLENRVIENVAVYIVELVHNFLETFVCKQLDSFRNRNITSVQPLADELTKYSTGNNIIQQYKKDSVVQLKDNVNILAEISKTYKLSYKRKNSKARVGDAIRNIKVKQYMRVCPVDTPESKDVGLNTYLSTTASVDENGFITAAYYDVIDEKIVYMNALDEMGIPIMVWNEDLNEHEYVRAHIDGEFTTVHRSQIRYMDVSPTGLLSFSTGYVPFIGNNKPKRALMATNMNRQAVHVLGSERPLVVTATDNLLDAGITRARDIVTEWAISKEVNLTEEEINNTTIKILSVVKDTESGNMDSSLREITFSSNNSKLQGVYTVKVPYYLTSTSGCYYYMKITQGVLTFTGKDIVYCHRDIASDDATVANAPEFGKMLDITEDRINECGYALGRNLKILFKSYKGYTYEDAVVLNRDLFEDKSLTSIFLKEIKVELQSNEKNGVIEMFTNNIGDGNRLSSEDARHLTSNGLPIVGDYYKGGQTIIGRVRIEKNKLGITSNDKQENASITLDSKSEGWVVSARIIPEDLAKGTQATAVVSVASFKDVSLGDKFVGRHGNKGVVAVIVPAEDMPFAEDGTIPDMVLSPLGTIARGNVGQLCECLVGMAGYKMNKRFVIPDLSDKNYDTLMECDRILKEEYGFDEQTIYDGETGLPYPKKMLIGVMHMYKLLHIAERPAKVIGSAINSVQEVSQQPRNGQRISELQVNAFIAHGATRTLDSLFSIQADDIEGAKNLKDRIVSEGTSLKDNLDLKGDNKSTEVVRAFLRTLGADIISVEGGLRLKYLTDEDIFDIAGGNENVVYDASKTVITSLHEESIFGAENGKESMSIANRNKRRNNYGRIELGYSVIMPIIFRSPHFLKRFQFVKWTFDKAKFTDEDGFVEYYLKCSVNYITLSGKYIGNMLEGKYDSLAFLPEKLTVFDTADLDKLGTQELKDEALRILKEIGFNMTEFGDRAKKGKFYSPQKIDVIAEMFRNYNKETLEKVRESTSNCYDTYENYLMTATDFGLDDAKVKGEFVYNTKGMISSIGTEVTIRGEDYFVSQMLIMPASFRPRFVTSRGDRRNDIDSTYSKILTCSKDLKDAQNKGMPIDFNVSRLYQALDSCYKKTGNSKRNVSIADLLLSSNINKGSTAIRGYVGAKRVSYSGRSVIAVNPKLKLTEVGIPYKQALSIWEDNLVWALKDKQLVEGKTSLSESNIRKLLKCLVDGNYYAIGHTLYDIHDQAIEVAKQVEDIVVAELIRIMQDEVVTLNREPSLHKFNTLAFVPILCDGLSIQLHPSVCTCYNADFDGDTMMYVSIKSETAKIEAREKMMATNNIINPKDGSNIITLKQDIVLGIYMLTMLQNNSTDEIAVLDREPVAFYDSISILEQDIDLGFISTFDYVAFRRRRKNNAKDTYYVSTAGRILFNSLLPEGEGLTSTVIDSKSNLCKLGYDKRIDSKVLNSIIVKCFEDNTENKVTIDLLDTLKEVGMKYADKSGATLSIKDFADRSYLVADKLAEVEGVIAKYDLYEKLKIFPSAEKSAAVIKLWEEELKGMQDTVNKSMDKDGSVYAIINSGARGAESDFNAIAGIVGQVRNVDGTMIERPVLGNFLKGLSADEYFISTYQARRGQISTSTKTADSGKNNRDISHVLNNVRVVEDDCGAEPYKLKLKWAGLLDGVAEQIVGKKITGCKHNVLVGKEICERIPEDGDEDKYLTIAGLELTQLTELELDGTLTKLPRHLDPVHRSLLECRVVESEDNEWLPVNRLKLVDYTNSESRQPEYTITKEILDMIESDPHEDLAVRLLIGCKAHGGVCSKCYGKDIETKKLIEVGKYIGLISAMAISEVATQGTMNVHHATASASGLGDVATRFTNALHAKEMVKVSRKLNKDTREMEYTVSMLKGDRFIKVADGLTSFGAIREQGLAVTDGIIKITSRETADRKKVVQLISNDNTYEYHISSNDLIVSDGQEVRQYQPLMAPYDYNRIMELDENYAREFYITDFANIFFSAGNKVRAIHFELIGREQCNYYKVEYTVDGCAFTEPYERCNTEEDILEDLQKRYAPANVKIRDIKSRLVGRNDVMDGKDIIANLFSDFMFAKLGKYCMNGRVDNGTSPLSNIYVGKEIKGDKKVFSTMNTFVARDKVNKKKHSYRDADKPIEELDTSGDLADVDLYGFNDNSYLLDNDTESDDGTVVEQVEDSVFDAFFGTSTDTKTDDTKLGLDDSSIETKSDDGDSKLSDWEDLTLDDASIGVGSDTK